MTRIRSLFAVFLYMVSAAGTAWAERNLLVEGDTRVFMEGAYYCGQPAVVVVESSRPQLFQDDAPQLQRMVDGIRAMLVFECPALHEIQMQGRLTGMGTVVYRGAAKRDKGWRLETRESIRAETDTPPHDQASIGSSMEPRGYSIAGLDTGMTVDEAMEVVRREFGVEPSYTAPQRVLRFEAGGCPPGYDPATVTIDPGVGWKCLRGWFSDTAEPRLSRFELIQVTAHDSSQEVVGLLEKRFGPTTARWTEIRRSGGLWGSEREVIHLAWGSVVGTVSAEGAPPRPTYELEAAIDRIKGVSVTTLTRAASAAVSNPPVKADLKL